MDPRLVARLIAGGRVGLGALMLVAPGPIAERWLGSGLASRPGVLALMRALGARDLVIGLIAAHTVSHPEVGPRWQATCAAVDTADAVATAAARRDLPVAGVAGTIALAGGTAVVETFLARALRRVAA